MNFVYYCLVLINAAVSVAVAAAVFWKNRHQAVGPLFAATMLINAVWLLGFAHYFLPMARPQAMGWAKLTLAASILTQPFLFHSMCALVSKMRRFQWWIVGSYAAASAFLLLLWRGLLVTGLRPVANMDHYISCSRALYPLLSLFYFYCQWGGAGVLIYEAKRAVGYKRTQLVYFIIAWGIVFLTTNSIILPLEYNFNVPPFGFLMLPLNLAFLAYVMAKARLADFNVVIARVLLHTITLVVLVGASLLFIGAVTLLDPNFMGPQHIVFTIMLVMVIGLGLTVSLPRFLPRAERMMQERMFGKRYGYQDALANLVKELSRLPTIEDVLSTVATTVHSQMRLSRAIVLLEDPLSAEYRAQAHSGLSSTEDAQAFDLADASPLIQWLRHHKDTLVRDEIARHLPPHAFNELAADLDRLKVTVCVPMILEERLVGLLALGEKVNREMFFVSDLRLLETLATEVALAVRYRRMEDQILRKNKLIELGTVAAGVAHEIRNPLASIRTFAQLMPDRMDDPEFKNEFSRLVIKDVDRITKVVESMLAFARPAQVQIAEHSATDLVEEAIVLVQPRLKGKSIELTRQFHEHPVLRVDKQQILQVLVNLLSNAADALPERGKIRVATGARILEGASENNGAQKFAVIEVADNGPGIPPAIRTRLFDPFFTTKKEGTGLGLSISQKIVRDHGGIITVSSIEGKGSTFQVNLPLS